jgi:hypothetical protein
MRWFTMTAEARKLLEVRWPGMSPDKIFAENGLCDDCSHLPG